MHHADVQPLTTDSRERAHEISLLHSTAALLYWDQQTFMPPKALDFRAEQLSYFSGKAHRLFTAGEVGDWIKACEDAGLASDGDAEIAANVRGWRHDYDRATKLPADLVEEYERAKVIANTAWTAARRRSDFAIFAPHLEHVFIADPPPRRPVGLRGRSLRRAAGRLRARGARGRVGHAVRHAAPGHRGLARAGDGTFRARARGSARRALSGGAAGRLSTARWPGRSGSTFAAGTINTTTHPFCNGLAPGDTRLTTRYDEGNFLVSLYGVMHEAGHGMYEQGLPHRGVRHAGGDVRVAGHPRIAEPVVGKSGRPRAGVLGSTGCRAPRTISRTWRNGPRRRCSPPSTACGRRSSAWRPIR